MKCPKCRVNLSLVDKYCPRCGEIFDSDDVEKLGSTLENDLLNIYTNKICGRLNFSLGYLLFNFFYALYKKMYYEAVIGAVATGLLIHLIFNGWNMFLSSLGFNALLIIFLFMLAVFVNIYYILKFDELYLIRAKGYIAGIIKNYGYKDVKLLINLCKKDSKANLMVFLSIIVLIGIFVYFVYIH